MNKKQKRKLCLWIVFAVLVVACVVALTVYGNRKPEVNQFYQENSDIMEFNPFITNEERLDNSLLEYGKVLDKYSSKGYVSYVGEDISIVPADYSVVSFTYDNGEDVSLGIDKTTKKISSITYKGKVYDWAKAKETLTDLVSAEFADELTKKCEEHLASTLFTENYEYKYYEDLPASEKNVTSANASDRYTEKTNTIAAEKNALVTSTEEYSYTYTIEVKDAGLYSLSLEYFMMKNRDNSAVLGLYVNDKLPFKEAAALELKRSYGFYDVGSMDIGGAEIMAQQQELFYWNEVVLQNPNGIYRNPYKFYLEKGTNTITLTFSREPAVVRNITLIAPLATATYEEYLKTNKYSDDKVYTGDSIKLQLEVPDIKTNKSLRMLYDKNYATEPAAYKDLRYNIFGGDRWAQGGEGATWKFEIEEDGFYQLGFRYQNTLTDIAVFREIKIDGEIPFKEMEEYCFPYSDGWIGDALKDANQNPYLFYLTKGSHTITITSKVGPLRSATQRLSEIMDSVSGLVSDVANITGAKRNDSGGYTVDKNRDWDLQLYITDIQEQMDYYVESFNSIYDTMKAANGGVLPYYGSSVTVACNLFERLAEDLEDIPISLNDINDTLSSLSTTLSEITTMPFEVDYMVFSGTDEDYADARSNSWQNFKVGVVQFGLSFTEDYSSMGTREGTTDEDAPEIEVYVARGREYVDILRNLIAEEFTPKTGIKVKVNMVTTGVEGLVMLRYVAGTAPDVALGVNAAAPVEYACRGALVPLNDLDGDGVDDGDKYGFYTLKSQYANGSYIYSAFQDNYFSLPETQLWSALFYRTDILEELELDVPDTWEDVYKMLPVLQENNYEFYYPYGIGNLYPFLYQSGVSVYTRDGMESALDTEVAQQAFLDYCNLYNKYNLSYASNFYMNFKMGSNPIGVADVNFYCQLKYSAPEIADKWAMAPIPGKVQDDGSIYRGMGGSLTSCIILKNEDKERTMNSWEFLKWWLGEEVQTAYANEVEATFGVGSRWQTANKNAIQKMPYTDAELEIINTMWDDFMETPVVLGGYYTNRYLLTALNQAILQGMNPRAAVEDAVREINKEMKRKQDDFDNLFVDKDYVINYSLIDGSIYDGTVKDEE